MSAAPRSRILLFGSSANPPTGEQGHLGLVRWVVETADHAALGGPVDELWILPVYRHAFAEKSGLVPFEHRFEMCRLCFEDRDWRFPVRVCDVERTLARTYPDVSLGTIDLVDHLEARHPQTRFVFLMGADTAADLLAGRWKRGDELRARVDLVVVPRDGDEVTAEPGLSVAWGAPRLEASSTRARKAAAAGQLDRWVTAEVAAYAITHRLYGAFDSSSEPEG